MHAKFALVLVLLAYHVYLGKLLADFKHDRNAHGHVFYRWLNEIPALPILVAVVLAIIVARSVTQRIHKLTVVADRLSHEQLPRLVDSLKNPAEDDVGYLTSSFAERLLVPRVAVAAQESRVRDADGEGRRVRPLPRRAGQASVRRQADARRARPRP